MRIPITTFLVAAVILTGALAGCGQKGPLYLPVTPPRTLPAQAPVATTAKGSATARPPVQAQNPPTATTKP